ncbi:uncharacterized protein EV420DRAFT_124478 [Desarmillaria tabescens]|uniref:Mitochondrial distribution and morphology protein 34 n=1 Tax=Armillaria tabescens TaxID=1929756 RepID=A0AA39N9Y5_ARMTA|nr:uncharacterized protein EV420DRAFT_124478 [Desarmillaria tabescens]KAK0461708.1 hypothetical protein EV420DRAFT_124478 [Desarmillaria tabescens]
MSFTFNWPRFSDQFHYDAIQMLNNALNKGDKPPIIADKIEVVELEMGTEPPELEIREIGELTMDQFRGIFRMSYAGDAHLVLKTKVQANPLNHKQPDIHLMAGTKGMLAAKQPLVVPMLLRLSQFKLRSIVVLVVSKQKGITLVFKTDPLQSVDINSTFDSIAVIQKFIQREIEGQLRQMFREDLPGIIHRLSQQWIKAKVEAPYLAKRPIPRPVQQPPSEPQLAPLSFKNVAEVTSAEQRFLEFQHHGSHSSNHNRRPPSSYVPSVASESRRAATTRSTHSSPPAPRAEDTSSSTFPDLENFDPTYGLRPEGVPTKSVFNGFSSLFTPNRGLADLAEEESEAGDYDDESTSYDLVDWDDDIEHTTPPSSDVNEGKENVVTEYETIPAVGGGMITRPRIYHSQSMLQSPGDGSSTAPLRRDSRISLPSTAGSSRPGFASPGFPPPSFASGVRRANSLTGPYFSDYQLGNRSFTGLGLSSLRSSPTPTTASPRIPHQRPITPESPDTPSSSQAIPTPPAPPSERYRRFSVSSSPTMDSAFLPSGSHQTYTILSDLESSPKIIIRPSLLNNTISHFSTLSHSNRTLSPYTRSLQHFTVRSGPPRYGEGASLAERQPVKAKRKRTYHIGSAVKPPPPEPEPEPEPPAPALTIPPPDQDSSRPPSEFDLADMDRYFRSYDDLNQNQIIPNGSPNMHPNHVRLRRSYLHPE